MASTLATRSSSASRLWTRKSSRSSAVYLASRPWRSLGHSLLSASVTVTLLVVGVLNQQVDRADDRAAPRHRRRLHKPRDPHRARALDLEGDRLPLVALVL